MDGNCKMDYCIPQETKIEGVKLAQAYVPFQKLCSIYNPLEALKKGTLFPELYSPYEVKNKCRGFREEYGRYDYE